MLLFTYVLAEVLNAFTMLLVQWASRGLSAGFRGEGTRYPTTTV